VIGMLPVGNSGLFAQNEYLATLNYQDITVDRIRNVPGVTWIVSDRSAYDQNHQRLFFSANPTNQPPWYLYTLDAMSGSVISQANIHVNADSNSVILGLTYDNAADTLYGLFFSRLDQGIYFSWIDPASGTAHPKTLLSAVAGYTGGSATFDKIHHRYIFGGVNQQGAALFVIDARTGAIVYSPVLHPGAGISNLYFDNATDKLYGVSALGAQGALQFDSVELTTGAEDKIADLTQLDLPQAGTTAIDEADGRYIFLASTISPAGCVTEYLYTLDIATGKVLSDPIYPFATAPGNPADENVIDYSYDNNRGLLYALNWHVTAAVPGPAAPSVGISASADTICPGTAVVFSAKAVNSLVTASYHWQANGNPVGTNNVVYSDNQPANGDSVRCLLIEAGSGCAVADTAISNSVVVAIKSCVAGSPPPPPIAPPPAVADCLDIGKVKVTPNPSGAQMLISFGQLVQSVAVNLYNSIGERVMTRYLRNSDHLTIGLTDLAAGYYVIAVYCPKGFVGTVPVVIAR
jgi:hypothetical protein